MAASTKTSWVASTRMTLVRHRLPEKTLDMCLIFVLPLFRKANVLKANTAGAVEQHALGMPTTLWAVAISQASATVAANSRIHERLTYMVLTINQHFTILRRLDGV
jgi:hypothetical protein